MGVLIEVVGGLVIVALIVRGFIEPIARELPMEYAVEAQALMRLSLEGAVG